MTDDVTAAACTNKNRARDDHAPCLRPLTLAHVDEVVRIEQGSYAFPWSRGNFIDSLASGYWMQVLRCVDNSLVAYVVAMPGVGEMHLLNITVAPRAWHQGHAREMLAALEDSCRQRGARQLWLEVRVSNERARAIYRRHGFVEVGRRKGYYPAAQGRREDAIVMSLAIEGAYDGLE